MYEHAYRSEDKPLGKSVFLFCLLGPVDETQVVRLHKVPLSTKPFCLFYIPLSLSLFIYLSAFLKNVLCVRMFCLHIFLYIICVPGSCWVLDWSYG